MPFTHLFLRDIGPFQDLHLDLTDGQGRPHLGPHVLAGVNGSGKSTALRALALANSMGRGSQNLNDFAENFAWSRDSLIMSECVSLAGERSLQLAEKRLGDTRPRWDVPNSWLSRLESQSLDLLPGKHEQRAYSLGNMHLSDSRGASEGVLELVAGYRPALSLRSLKEQPHASVDEQESRGLGALGFDSTVENTRVQQWLISLFSRQAIAEKTGQAARRFDETIKRVNDLLSSVFDHPVQLDIDIDSPVMQARFHFAGRSLNFSQLPDGVRYLLGLAADFIRRQDLANWDASVKDKKPSVLLIDEIDGHLHPKWQRQVLPALKTAFPDVQIIVSTHSPFVITSCDGAIVHVLELSTDGNATANPPMQAPVGMSLEATIKDVFGVESRFGVQTERVLEEWNALQKRNEAGSLSDEESAELNRLTADLASRGEELRLIVESAGTLSKKALQALLNS